MMKKNIEISIIIPCYNAQQDIATCIEAIKKSSYKNYEIICVNDCSKDDTCRIALSYDNVRILNNKTNCGAACARNKGVRTAKGKIVIFIDSDILIMKDTLKKIHDKIIKEKKDAVVGIYSTKHYNKGAATNYKNLHIHYTYSIMPPDINIANSSCLAIRKEAFNKIGGFDENITGYSSEDWDLGQKMASAGYTVYLDKSLQIIHMKNFCLSNILKTDAIKACSQVKMLMRSRKRKKKIMSVKRVGSIPWYIFASAPLVFLILASLIISLSTMSMVPVYLLIAFIAAYLVVNSSFFLFLWREKGLVFFLQSIGIYYLNIWSMIFGGIKGFTDYFILHKRY